MKKRVNIPALLVCMALLLFALVRVDVFLGALQRDFIRQWLQRGREPWTGVIRVWHVTDWLPGRGSGASWFDAVGRSFEKKYHGVFVEVEGMTMETAEKRLTGGEKPDVLSFPAGWGKAEWLAPLKTPEINDEALLGRVVESGSDGGHTLRALPVMRGAYVLLVNTDLAGEREVRMPGWDWDMEWLQKAQTALTFEQSKGKQHVDVDGLSMARNRYSIPELALILRSDFAPLASGGDEIQFAQGRAGMCIGTLRTLYNQRAAEEAGGGVSFQAQAVGSYSDMVQYAGVWHELSGYRQVYAEKYVHFLLQDREQKKLSAVGALSVMPVTEPMYEQDTLMRALLETGRYPKAFGWERTHAQIVHLAQRALEGDAAAKAEMEKALMLVLLGKT